MNNNEFFEFSIANPDDFFNDTNPQGTLVISSNTHETPTWLMSANKKLLELICTYKTLSERKLADNNTVNNIIDEIIHIIETTPLINYSAFCSYLLVVDYSYSKFMEDAKSLPQDKKRELMETFISLYIEHRHDLYLFHGYSDQVLQVNSDNASSRRKGKTGITSLENVLLPLGFKKVYSLWELEKTDLCYILPDKGGKHIFNEYLAKNNIKFEFRQSRDNKNPDMFIKIHNDVFITEHKLTNGGGGSQNAEINEIIHFIKYTEQKENIHYVSCLQGNYFKRLNNKLPQDPKASQQTQNIYNALKDCPQNYFLNGKGFNKLIEYYLYKN